MDGQGTKRRRKIAENLNRLSMVHQRYRRQTDRQTRDGTAIAYSEREREFTLAKNCKPIIYVNATDKITLTVSVKTSLLIIIQPETIANIFNNTERRAVPLRQLNLLLFTAAVVGDGLTQYSYRHARTNFR